ncbi:MAG: hypothetical protein KJO62_06500 [Gammaproteobacteria bacterium]|nr:hypothetical protein [Gammaproteobacteria bacterium]NND39273.1 hypothetical protein [Pseudomonadales bacterium]
MRLRSFKHSTISTFAATALLCLSACGGGGGGGSTGAESLPPAAALQLEIYAPADVLLEWNAPLSRADQTILLPGEIQGYQICYTDSAGNIRIIPENPAELQGQSTYLIENLTPDDYQFNIFTIDTDASISAPSATVQLSIENFPIL